MKVMTLGFKGPSRSRRIHLLHLISPLSSISHFRFPEFYTYSSSHVTVLNKKLTWVNHPRIFSVFRQKILLKDVCQTSTKKRNKMSEQQKQMQKMDQQLK